MRLAEAELGTETTPLRMVPSHNMQAHALTAARARTAAAAWPALSRARRRPRRAGSAARGRARVRARLRVAGITDLFEPSVCLLHYQANGSLPAECDVPRRCRSSCRNHARPAQHELASLPAEMLAQLDNHTAVDAQAGDRAASVPRPATHVERTGASLRHDGDAGEQY